MRYLRRGRHQGRQGHADDGEVEDGDFLGVERWKVTGQGEEATSIASVPHTDMMGSGGLIARLRRGRKRRRLGSSTTPMSQPPRDRRR